MCSYTRLRRKTAAENLRKVHQPVTTKVTPNSTRVAIVTDDDNESETSEGDSALRSVCSLSRSQAAVATAQVIESLSGSDSDDAADREQVQAVRFVISTHVLAVYLVYRCTNTLSMPQLWPLVENRP